MKSFNPVIYFEIPVLDLKRACNFYANVFGYDFEFEEIDGCEMAMFPFSDKLSGITGALAKGDVYKPSKEGVIVYFRSENIDTTLQRVLENGGVILYPKTYNDKYNFYVAEIEDSEGNRIAVQQIIEG